jgi:hypothetical protein
MVQDDNISSMTAIVIFLGDSVSSGEVSFDEEGIGIWILL